jgi:Uma2 family endonuclease
MPVSDHIYKQVALEDPDGHWELACGRLRGKPGMTIEHNDIMATLAEELILQLDRREYRVRTDGPRLRVSGGSYYLPDVCVIPHALVERKRREAPRELEVYEQPMPLVVEVWSPSPGPAAPGGRTRSADRAGVGARGFGGVPQISSSRGGAGNRRPEQGALAYDVEEKLREYQRRGDLEIWRLHPYERTLTTWRRQPDGGYQESTIRGGAVQPVALPGVTIELGALFG